MANVRQDALHGFQMLLKTPGLTAVAALSLALGIGANTVIFSLINGTLLRPLAFPNPDRLVVIWKVPLDHLDQRNNESSQPGLYSDSLEHGRRKRLSVDPFGRGAVLFSSDVGGRSIKGPTASKEAFRSRIAR